MLKLENNNINITLPEGKTQEELIAILNEEFKSIEKNLYGLDIHLNGRITTGMALWLGHRLAHICKSVSIFDPKENKFILIIKH